MADTIDIEVDDVTAEALLDVELQGVGVAELQGVGDAEIDIPLAELLSRISSREATVAVVGLGYVGLPLALAFAEAGLRTVGLDLNEARVADINDGKSPVEDVSDARLAGLLQTEEQAAEGTHGAFAASADSEIIADADAIIICVPTPLNAAKEPDLSYIQSAADAAGRWMSPGTLVVLESTSYPGTTEEVVLPRLLEGRDCERRAAGSDFFLAFSPERIDPGRTDHTIRTTPKVVGGVTERCGVAARALYDSVVDQTVPVSRPAAAEMVKLLENTFRATNVALANEMAMICDRLDIDVWEVIDAAGTKPFGFMAFYPGPGLGGHCIPVDPQYLAWKMRTLNYSPRCIQTANEINLSMPAFVVSRVADALNDCSLSLQGSAIHVMGVAYKANISDVRESPLLELVELLESKGAAVSYHDPFVPTLRPFGVALDSVEPTVELLANADCVIVGTDHAAFDWAEITSRCSLVFDTRNALQNIDTSDTRVIKL